MSLRDWKNDGLLKSYPPVPGDIQRILNVVKRDLSQCTLDNLDTDWRFNIAYSAIIGIGTAALASSGYRAAHESHHYWVIQSMKHTLGLHYDIIDQMDSYRKKRNLNIYEEIGIISETEVHEIIDLANNLLSELQNWLKTNYPDLINP